MKHDRYASNIFLKLVRATFSLHYKVNTRGVENMPESGGVLLLPNHVSYVDAIILSLASPRPIRFLSEDVFFRKPVLGWILKKFNGIPISSRRAKDAIIKTSDALQAGEVVCIFPEGKLTRDGGLNELQAGFQLIARRANCPVLATRMNGLWGSIFSYYGGRLFTKLPRRLLRHVTVSFSCPISPESATLTSVSKEMRLLQDTALRERRGYGKTIWHGVLRYMHHRA